VSTLPTCVLPGVVDVVRRILVPSFKELLSLVDCNLLNAEDGTDYITMIKNVMPVFDCVECFPIFEALVDCFLSTVHSLLHVQGDFQICK